MKTLYFNSISRTIHKWIETNGNLEFELWNAMDEKIQQRPDGRFYTDMPYVMQKLIGDTMKSGMKISSDMKKPIFSVLVQGTYTNTI